MPSVPPVRAAVPFLLFLAALVLAAVPARVQAQARWTLAPELSIGTQGGPDYELTFVGALAVGAAGEIYVAQPEDGAVRVFDARGRHLRTLGRHGSGPGEYARVDGLGWKGDSLWVADAQQNRITFLGRDGRVLRTVTATAPVVPGAGFPAPPAGVLGDGRLIANPSPSLASVQRRTVGRLPLLRMSREGRLEGGFGEMDARGWMEKIERPHHSMTFTLPVQSQSLWSLAPDGSSVVVVHRPIPADREHGGFRVVRYDASGRVVLDRGYAQRARPTAEVADSVRAFLVSLFTQTHIADSPGQAQAFARDSVQLPRFLPLIDAVVAGRDGTIWLRRQGWGAPRGEYLVLDRDGRILANVAVPPRTRILQAQRDRVWAEVTDELDVPTVVRYRVRPAAP